MGAGSYDNPSRSPEPKPTRKSPAELAVRDAAGTTASIGSLLDLGFGVPV